MTSVFGRALTFSAMLFSLLAVSGGEAKALEKPFGIEQRTPWSTSRMVGVPEPPSPYLLEQVFPQLTLNHPIDLLPVPGTDQMLVVEVGGRILTFTAFGDSAGTHLAFDVAASIEGATRTYGFAFHPNFVKNRQCFICYVTKADDPNGSRVSRFRVTSVDPLRIDASSEQPIITWQAGGHNGGSLQFGPHDGLLYISTGDGSSPFPPDPKRTGQDISDLLASILRIDVDHASQDRLYSIPTDNPFVDISEARGEVWTYGHRNPWRMSFDRVTGHLWVGDVGWEMWEMIYRVQRGANYGWSILEHVQSVNPDFPRGPTPFVPPTAAHAHTESRSITGGHVYRGTRLPDLAGTYVYGDYVTGKIWGLDGDAPDPGKPQELTGSSIQVICFGVGHDQELYVVGYDGSIHQLARNPAAGSVSAFPKTLSATGLFSSTESLELAPGVIPYSVNAAPWADGTTASRFLALPGSATIGVHEINNVQKGDLKGEWSYPDGTVLGKTILLRTGKTDAARQQRLETQILYRHKGEWRAYCYLWNDEQTDAVLSDGKAFDRSFMVPDASSVIGQRSQTWHFASQTECLLCHTTRGGSVYGFRVEQLNLDVDYAAVKDNQLRTLAHLGLFERPLGTSATPGKVSLDELPRMAPPDDETADLTQRVRSYLHVNCSHCHRRGGGGTAAIEVPLDIDFEKTHLISRPTQGTFGIVDPWVVSPGDPERSVLFYRMSKVGRGRMPHFGSRVIDDQGLSLLREWITQLEPSSSVPVNDSDNAASTLALQLAATNRKTLTSLSQEANPASPSSQAAIDRLLSSTSGALLLASSIRNGGLTPEIRRAVIAKGTSLADPLVRDLFEAFVPEEARTRSLGTLINSSDLLTLDGSVEKGRSLFLTAAGMQCRNCHKVGDQGKVLGPDLTQIGKRYSPAEILENILEPSKKIDPKFQTWLVQTDDGKVHSGLLLKRTDTEVVLRDALGKDIHLSAGDIELMLAQRKSLMPEMQLRDMTAQDAADLLAWLSSLK
ncbi:MAG: PQQ-dependent sugar dehydrogenase [Planctomycetota bacterium]|nr:PQQ-dependent sugar dehydrogenase [Planctomycetota bacterium]MDA1164089.1 PQQ-dependent sugar dehydrogenase [Planctomycetota bacterium]